jgi:NAD(P)-dependent dehydrogenase (short-subunit alcohol dehydrogenase family)
MAQASRIAVVTGGGGGLGAAIAAQLNEDGFRVAVLDTNEAGALAVAATFRDARGYGVDITDEEAVAAVVGQIENDMGGPAHVVVNNAGMVRFGNLIEHSVADFRRVLDVNLTGAYIVVRAFAPGMMARKAGAIINITSLNAVAPSPDAGAYPTSKGGLITLTEHLALVLGPHGIRVNAVGPGFINAGMSAPIYANQDVAAVRGKTVPLGRLGEASDVANTVAFLASDKARYIHGQHILVDGGVSISLKNHLPRKAPG